MEPIALTPVLPADAAAFFHLFCRARGHDLGAAAWDEAIRAATLRIQFDAQQRGYQQQWPSASSFFLARGGERIGWTIVDRSGPSIHLVDLALVPEARGQGVGTTILRGFQDEAARAGRAVTLSVLRANLPAIRLYARLGFEPTGADDVHLRLEWRSTAAAASPAPTWSPARFRDALNTWFDVRLSGEPVLLLLKEVNEQPPAGGLARFSLLFQGPGDRPLPQDTYTLDHASMGQLTLFIVPVVGSSAARILYEACFSYPDPAAP
jgi:ribosomal protein S18 acetylase RimI-like enzyme